MNRVSPARLPPGRARPRRFLSDTQFAYFDACDAIGTYLKLLWLEEPSCGGLDQIRPHLGI